MKSRCGFYVHMWYILIVEPVRGGSVHVLMWVWGGSQVLLSFKYIFDHFHGAYITVFSPLSSSPLATLHAEHLLQHFHIHCIIYIHFLYVCLCYDRTSSSYSCSSFLSCNIMYLLGINVYKHCQSP